MRSAHLGKAGLKTGLYMEPENALDGYLLQKDCSNPKAAEIRQRFVRAIRLSDTLEYPVLLLRLAQD